MKKMISVMLAGLCASALLTGCGSSASSSASSSEASDSKVAAIKSAGKVVMYTNAEFPPFEYMEGETIKGVDVDIANEIAKELDVTLEIVNVEFESIVPSIQTGKGDFGAAGMTVKPEREEMVDFSIKYCTSKQYIIMKEDATFKTIEDLAGKKIGVQIGTTGEYTIDDAINGITDENNQHIKGELEGTGATKIGYNNALEATLALTTGKIDAIIIDKLPAENIVASNTGIKTIELVYADGRNTEEQYAICVQKGSDLLEVINTVLNRLMSEGKIDEYIVNHSTQAAVSTDSSAQ